MQISVWLHGQFETLPYTSDEGLNDNILQPSIHGFSEPFLLVADSVILPEESSLAYSAFACW